jgi:SAM-dependent methyltransferase
VNAKLCLLVLRPKDEDQTCAGDRSRYVSRRGLCVSATGPAIGETWKSPKWQYHELKVDPRKALVRDAYDAIAPVWGEKRREGPTSERERKWVSRFLDSLPIGARVLDLGCGVGVPILAELVTRGCRAVGVDFSRSSLRQARALCPGAALVRADLAEVDFAPAAFDAAVAFDSIWHVPRQEHCRVLAQLRGWLREHASVLLTLAVAPETERELFTDLLGAPIYYDAQTEAQSLSLLRASGFKIVDRHLQPISEGRPSTGHLIILAEAA